MRCICYDSGIGSTLGTELSPDTDASVEDSSDYSPSHLHVQNSSYSAVGTGWLQLSLSGAWMYSVAWTIVQEVGEISGVRWMLSFPRQ